MKSNLDARTVAGFGDEWSRYDQSALSDDEWSELFASYFQIFPFSQLPPGSVGADIGCGSGRWARGVAPRVGTLHCVDASEAALNVARRNLADQTNCVFHHASVDALPFADSSLDFLYSLGVLHHVPNTEEAIHACAAKMKTGALLLIYLYYDFDNRPAWFRRLWRASEVVRRAVSRMPHSLRYATSVIIASSVYWPLARTAKIVEKAGGNVSDFPLSFYRTRSFYVMRTDALDRFGTALEQRFSRSSIISMLTEAGFVDIVFNDSPPFWTACGRKG